MRKSYAFGFYAGLAVSLAALVALIYFIAIKSRLSDRLFLITFSIIAGAIRTVWIIGVKTLPASDYQAYQSYASNFTKGLYTAYDPTYPVFPFKIGYPIILSFLYKLTGVELNAAKALNIALSIITMLLLFYIGKHILNNRAGRTAALLFAFWPAQAMYCSTLASEHVFMVFFLLSILLLVRLKPQAGLAAEIFHMLLIGVTLAAAQFIRPVSLILFPVAAVYLFFIYERREILFLKIARKTALFAIIVLSYYAGLYCLNQAVQPITGIDIMKSSPGFNLMVGTNIEANGMYNKGDASIVKKYDYDFNKVQSEAFRTAIGRITGNPWGFASLVVKKYGIEWGNENYGYESAIISLNNSNVNIKRILSFSHPLKKISQAYYMIIILLSIAGCLYGIRRSVYKLFIPALTVLGLAISFCFFEVQSRYHIPAIPLLILISSVGLVYMFEGDLSLS